MSIIKMNNIKLKKGKWYFIKDPGSNLHRGYTGKAQCLNTEVSHDFCGGPSYLFKFFDEGNEEEGMFGLQDIVYEMKSENEVKEENDVRIAKLENKIKELEKIIKKIIKK